MQEQEQNKKNIERNKKTYEKQKNTQPSLSKKRALRWRRVQSQWSQTQK